MYRVQYSTHKLLQYSTILYMKLLYPTTQSRTPAQKEKLLTPLLYPPPEPWFWATKVLGLGIDLGPASASSTVLPFQKNVFPVPSLQPRERDPWRACRLAGRDALGCFTSRIHPAQVRELLKAILCDPTARSAWGQWCSQRFTRCTDASTGPMGVS